VAFSIPPPSSNQELLTLLEKAFAHHSENDQTIDLKELQKALGIRSEYLARRVLAAFDDDKDGRISKKEFVGGVKALVFGTARDKLWFAFRMHDHDGNGSLSREEVLRMITISLAESEIVERATQPPDRLTAALFAMADRNRDGSITFEELEAAMQRRPDLLHKMTRTEAIWIAPNEDLLEYIEVRSRGRKMAEGGDAMPVVFLVLYALANVAIFSWALFRNGALPRGQPVLMEIGRALGVSIDFNGALILLPMLRRFVSWIRRTWLGRLVPVDESVEFHRLVGQTLFALAVTHTAAFVAAYFLGHAHSLAQLLLRTPRGITGIVLLAVFFVMWFFSLQFVRRTKRFELFYFTHLLYVAWIGLAIAHARPFLWWIAVPLFGFVLEALFGLKKHGRARVLRGDALRSGVTRLEIERPRGFDFSPGDYALLKIPAIARHEWHPFTISCAPEHGLLTFHVRSLGNWTGALRRWVEDHPQESTLTCSVDGPYGTPSARIFRSKFVVLIGAGIGVTPFASVLESLVMRANGASKRPSVIEKAYFFWLNRDQYSFEWFTQLLAEIERLDQRGFLDIHLCMTNAKSGATSLGLELAREGMRAEGRGDIITGLRAHTHFGAPDWEGMLGLIARAHAPKVVDVYFCGPPGLSAKIEPICKRLGMTFRLEKF